MVLSQRRILVFIWLCLYWGVVSLQGAKSSSGSRSIADKIVERSRRSVEMRKVTTSDRDRPDSRRRSAPMPRRSVWRRGGRGRGGTSLHEGTKERGSRRKSTLCHGHKQMDGLIGIWREMLLPPATGLAAAVANVVRGAHLLAGARAPHHPM